MKLLLDYGGGLLGGEVVVVARALLSCQCGERVREYFQKVFKGGEECASCNCEDGGYLHGWIIGEEYDTCPSCANKSQEGK